MKRIILSIFILTAIFSCNDQSDKAASEFCDCFKTKQKKFSKELKKIMAKVADSKTPQKTLQKAVADLDDETKASINEELQQFKDLENDDKFTECGKKIADYKVRGKDQAERQQVVLDKMKGITDCEILSGLLAIGLEVKGNGTDKEDEKTDEDEPKKKKTTDDE